MNDRRPRREEGPDTAGLRDRSAQERDVFARRRDELSGCRDQLAKVRDSEATDLDTRDNLSDRHTLRVQELRSRGLASRARAARDRAQAAHDRQEAAGDRKEAAHDREHAGTDELTGARRRGVGLEELEREIKRARREGNSVVAAYVDVDGLKSVNDSQGHAGGDRLLKTVVEGVRRHMRDYDLLVRLGGDEFLCVLPSVTPLAARQRFDDLRAELSDAWGCSVSVGFSELRDDDSADEFIGRADSDLLARRSR